MRLARPATRPDEVTVAAGLVSFVLLAMARFWPFDRLPLVTCPLRRLVGIPCPACGMTRAFVALTHGRIEAALRVSPLGALLAFAAMMTVLVVALRLTVMKRAIAIELEPAEKRRAFVVATAMVAVNWAYLLVTRAAG